MKFLHIAVISLFVFAACNKMESSEPVTPAKVITSTADKLNTAMINQDFETFAKYTHPKVIEVLGGAQKFKEMMTNGAKGMNDAGVRFISITNGEPGKIITKDNELQTILPQTIEMKTPTGRVKTKTALIAISSDNGKTWHFVDTFNSDLKRLQVMMPNLSNELVIPAPQPPEVVLEK
ncbi:MAG: hypothetical protein V4642_08560 [Bacteroidota bacterium]